MRSRSFKQVDVFTATPYFGNPLAVVLDGIGMDDAAMQRFAQWTNLSETTFLLPPTDPTADYRVRIFTPGGELPFAGHPTLGSCHSWLQAGGTPKSSEFIVQECKQGLVRLRRELVEGGGQLLGSLFDAGLVDRVVAFVSPKLVGGASAPGPVAGQGVPKMSSAISLKEPQWEQVGDDLMVTGYVDRVTAR